jgi:hypothetical protein
MKIKNYWVILAGSAIVLTSSGRSFAQTQLTRDGYAVTPKILQMTENGGTAEPAMGGGGIIMGESPGAKVVIGASGQRTVVFAPSYYELQNIGYRTTWDDGVAASPRLRQTMMENKYAAPAMGGSEYIGEESMRGNVTVTPQGQRVWLESPPSGGVSTKYNTPPRVGYARSFDFGIAAPPRAWKMMIENPANREMFALR